MVLICLQSVSYQQLTPKLFQIVDKQILRRSQYLHALVASSLLLPEEEQIVLELAR